MKYVIVPDDVVIRESPPTRGCELKYLRERDVLPEDGHPPRGGAN